MPTRGGEVKSFYIVDATTNAATNYAWDSTTVQAYTVPAGKRWYVYGGTVKRDTATGTATLDVSIYDSAAHLVLTLATAADATTLVIYPVAATVGHYTLPFILDEGWTVTITIGEAQGAAAYATCHVLQMG